MVNSENNKFYFDAFRLTYILLVLTIKSLTGFGKPEIFFKKFFFLLKKIFFLQRTIILLLVEILKKRIFGPPYCITHSDANLALFALDLALLCYPKLAFLSISAFSEKGARLALSIFSFSSFSAFSLDRLILV